MPKGTVSFFNKQGSYGFITIEDADGEGEGDDGDGDDDVFFHMADLGGPDLAEGQEVEFEIEQSDKGPRAANLTRLGDAAVNEADDEGGRRTEDGVIVDEDGTRWVSINDM